MKFSRVSVLFLAILVMTLSIKFGLQKKPRPLDVAYLERAVTGELQSRGYRVSVERRTWGPVVRAIKPDCRMLVAPRVSDGATRDRIADLAAPFGPMVHVYRGRISSPPPVWEPLARDLVINQLQQFGVSANRSPVLAVAASSGCNLTQINWSRLASMP